MGGNLDANPTSPDTSALQRGESLAPGGLQRRFFFFHVPKTGGATIYNSFQRKYGGEVVRPKKKRGVLVDVAYTRKFFLPPAANHRDFAEWHIAGHFASLSIIEGREAKYHKVCFWRHPADWYLSYYNWRHVREKHKPRRSFSFSDFVNSLLRNPMSQEFLLYCGDMPGWRYFLASDRQKFDAAVALAEKFDLFADISKVDEYLKSTGLAEDGAAIKYYHKIPEQEKKLKALDGNTRRRLELENPIDYYMYRIALGEDVAQVFAEARRQLSDRFDFRDLVRQLVRPYYRFKVLFLPYVKWPPLGGGLGVLWVAEQSFKFLA